MRKALLGLLVGMAIVPTMMANQVQVGYPGSNYGLYQTGLGGEFTMNPINPAGWLDLSGYATQTKDVGVGGTFQTFCVEGLENIYPYASIYDAVVNTKAINGGVQPPGVGDPISVGTGWLYSQFATANWDATYGLSYNYGDGRTTSADALQRALWWLEGEESIAYNATNPYMLAVVNKFLTRDGAQADGGWNYGVYALNLTSGATLAQDVLVYIPGTLDIPGTPDGGLTAMLLGMGMLGLGWVRRMVK